MMHRLIEQRLAILPRRRDPGKLDQIAVFEEIRQHRLSAPGEVRRLRGIRQELWRRLFRRMQMILGRDVLPQNSETWMLKA